MLTICAILILHVQLAKPEITKSNVSSVIEQNILWLQVTVDDVETVQALQCTEQLRSVETGSVNIEPLLLLKVMEKLSTIDEGQDQVQLFW